MSEKVEPISDDELAIGRGSFRQLPLTQPAERIVARIDQERGQAKRAEARCDEAIVSLSAMQTDMLAERRRANAAEAEAKRLREALEPFATEAKSYRNGEWCADDFVEGVGLLNVGHLWRAHEAFYGAPPGAEKGDDHAN